MKPDAMNKPVIASLYLICAFCLAAALLSALNSFANSSNVVNVIKISGAIGPVTQEYIAKAIDKANKTAATALIIEMDTPGGLDTSMRTIVKEITGSKTPVVVYVSPSGARAASAGVFITMAAHIAAMSPGTNIGAAHPVSLNGEMDKTTSEKAENDAVAYIKSIAQARKRNAAWAEEAVRKSVSLTANEALTQGVIDLIATDIDDLLKKIDGRQLQTDNNTTVVLNTSKSTYVVRDVMGWRLTILSLISDPNVAYILMLIGMYGLLFELSNPGAVFPGIAGGISIILAFYAFQTLPVNYAGLLLIMLAIVMFILELKIVSHGALTIGGIISMTIGSLMLFEESSPFFRLSLYIIAISVIVTVVFFSVIAGLSYKAWKRRPVTGVEGLIGAVGAAVEDINKDSGMALVNGALWQCRSDAKIVKGMEVRVVEVSGLRLKVEPLL
ncbi:NfeD family protein [Candidatus Magnetominusculus xianensis]|uniref:Serine protease n=1 Tax=Candidatus Magnetominusculus xianensis TaxID=1748249 RepID=A0ABR5SIU1_9BACT|nr:nodulation protein NfeD [Candidatus Magnetominusculus xianensis]KWT92853.1 serine protease [Candidatus Magnetominusculus xianensis]